MTASSAPSSLSPQASEFWNQVHIDVHAEFSPIRLPLDELKQMSEGLVVDVGSLAHNTIRLHVDGKTVAHGELVIVGDRFGVRIQHLSDGQEPSSPPTVSLTQPPTASNAAIPKATPEKASPKASAEPDTAATTAPPLPAETDDEDDW